MVGRIRLKNIEKIDDVIPKKKRMEDKEEFVHILPIQALESDEGVNEGKQTPNRLLTRLPDIISANKSWKYFTFILSTL